MALPRYKLKDDTGTLPDWLRFRTFENVRGAYESIDGKVFVIPKKEKDVFEKERRPSENSSDSPLS